MSPPDVPALAGLVLCGGRSRRMRSDKALLERGGRPLVLVAAERLARVASPVLLAPGRPGRLGDLGLPEIADEIPGSGPLGGLVAGLAASPHPAVAVLAADMPFASAEVLALLAALRRDEDVVAPVSDHGPEPLHAVWSPSALPVLRAALAERRLRLIDLLGDLRVRLVRREEWGPADPEGRFALNVNRPEDLEWLC